MLDLYANVYAQPSGWMLLGLLIIVAWEAVWKGIALWFSAKNQQKGWFVVLFVLNTLGLLPIIYLIWFRPKAEQEEAPAQELEISEEPKKFSKKVIKPAKKKPRRKSSR